MSLERVDVAMVLAAGLGTRMRPLTDDRPKALVEVGGRALIDHTLDRLAADGVRRAVVNVHHFADALESHLARRAGAPQITVSDERAQLLETGGGLVRARPLLGEAPIFVCNIDSVWLEEGGAPTALAGLRAAFDPARMDALLLLTETERAIGFSGAGDFHMDAQGRLARRGGAATAQWAFMGVHVTSPAIVDGWAEEPFSLNRVWDGALARGRVYGHRLAGRWMHVGDPAARDEAEARLAAAPDAAA
ncbi:MAG: nucleotidyltransferase family protein [Caulobacterales bacterium]|nr:nucleotidyltransferase family protein [Caulobacterales bacterium]